MILATRCKIWNPQRRLLCADQRAGSGSKSQKSCLTFSIQGPCRTAVLVGVLLGLSSLVFWVLFPAGKQWRAAPLGTGFHFQWGPLVGSHTWGTP